jgi:tetratricopeptide (TPR) repeat protein
VAATLSAELEGMVLNRLGHMEWAFCDLPAARASLARAVRIWEHEDRPEELAYAWEVTGWCQLWAGEFDAIPRTERLGREALERGFNLRWYVWTLSFASLAYSPMGRFADAVDRGERALAMAQEYDDASLVCFASWVLGFAHLARGDFARALELGARAVDVAPTPQDLSWAGASHAWIQCRAGALEEEGIRVLEEAVVAHRAARSFTGEIWATALAESYLSVGRLDDARTTLDEVSAVFTANETAYYGGMADRLRGEVERAADRGPAGDEEARRSFERAIGSLRDIGAEAELADALAGLGRLEAERGDAALGSDLLAEARAIHERLGTVASTA